MHRLRTLVLGLVMTMILPCVGQTVPQMMNYQGRLTDDGGSPITTATTVEFRIYDASSGGTQLWMESQSVTPDAEGLFSVRLGSVNAIPDSALAPTETYLGVTVGGDPELTPRVALLAAPYAVRVATIDGAKGGVVSGNIELDASTAETGNIYKGGQLFLHTSGAGYSVFIGENAGNLYTTGGGNTGIGRLSLNSNTTGGGNTGFGYTSLKSNYTGSDNTAVGVQALTFNTGGASNTSIGAYSMQNNTTGYSNTAIGSFADVASGNLHNATAIGYGAIVDASNKIRLGNDDVTAIVAPAPGVKLGIGTNTPTQALDVVGTAKVEGFQMATGSGDGLVLTSDASGVGTWQPAGGGSTSGWQDDGNAVRLSAITDSVGIGTATPQANLHVAGKVKITGGNIELDSSTATTGNIYKGGNLFLHDYGSSNLFMGRNAGNQSMTGGGNIAYGRYALFSNTEGGSNTAVGGTALMYNTTGYANTAIGTQGLMNNTTGYANTAIGYQSLSSNITGWNNTAIGSMALVFNTTGGLNVAIGDGSLRDNTTAYGNVAIGSEAMRSNSTGSYNTATGFQALTSNTVGQDNTANGIQALYFNTEGSTNAAFGGYSLLLNTTGSGNTAIGFYSLSANSTGLENTAIGSGAMGSNSTGYSNTATGNDALLYNTTGSMNTAIGFQALFSNATGMFNTAIGTSADVGAANLSNATAIGCGAIVNASNKVRIGNHLVTVIEGQVAYTFSSDRNTKENFQPVDGEEVLEKISEWNLTSWNYKDQDPATFRHYGPMAQEFFAAFGHDGMGQIGDSVTINSGDEAGILFVAVKALEQRTAEIARIKQENLILKKELSELKRAVTELLAQSKASDPSPLGMK